MVKLQSSRRLRRRDAMVAFGCAALVVAYFILDMNLSQNLIPKSSDSFSFQGAHQITRITQLLGSSERTRQIRRTIASRGSPPTKSNPAPISCDRSHHDYDICSVNGPVTLDQARPIFYTPGSTRPISEEKLRPYPRKWESFTMSSIKEVTLVTSAEAGVPPCRVRHDAPALVFSAGGYTGNFFHDFNDGFVPLFVTMSIVNGGSDDVVLVISKAQDWWMRKYAEILRAFSRYEIVDLDNHKVTHCFTSATVGLVSHGFMTIDSARIPNGKSFTHFRAILDKAFNSKGTKEKQSKPLREIRPRLVLATRSGLGGRVILNQKELKNAAVQEGFEVIEFEPTSATPLQQAYDLLQSSHALVGVHGAALTHILFLRPGSTFLQIIPIGADWVSEVCFGKPAKDLGLDYLQYDVVANESTLTDIYGADHPLIRDPAGSRGGWKTEVMSVYLKEQNVKVDLVRFRGYLKKMYSKAKMFIENENKL